MENRSIQTSDIILHYRMLGNGPSVMLLHGFAEDGKIWKKIEGPLSEKYSLIIPELPGTGASIPMEKKDADVQLTDYAELINEILIAEKIKNFSFIGHSMGGYIALAFAEKYASKISGLGLFHSSAFAASPPQPSWRSVWRPLRVAACLHKIKTPPSVP